MANKRPPMYLLEIVPATEDFMKRIQRLLSPAEVKALVGTPINLLPSPGPGKFYNPIEFVAYLTFNTTPYANAANHYFDVGNPNAAWFAFAVANLVQSGVDGIMHGNTPGSEGDASLLVDQPMQLSILGAGELTNGDSDILVIVYYTVEATT